LEPLARGVKKVPGVGPGLVKGVEDYIKLFKDAAKQMDTAAQTAISLTAKGAKNPLTKAEANTLKDALKQSSQFRGFRDYTGKGGIPAGIGRLWGNRGTRGLMRRTKWYLGLLDFLGIGNFVGPEELEQNVDNLDKKVEEYSKTEQSQKLWDEDMAVAGPETATTGSAETTKTPSKFEPDAISTLISMFT
jgi:Sec-independent protein translocase protein TatA